MSTSEALPLSNVTVAIDGPAGAGKSTVAKRVARELGLKFLDTGAMYRALALKAQRQGIGPAEGEAAGLLAAESEIGFGAGDPPTVWLDGEDITNLIRTPEIGELASALSAHSPVRRVLAQRQTQLVKSGGYVLEGRDTTTVTAPHAEVKIFLTASLDERARRRYEELAAKGESHTLQSIKDLIAERDHRDSTREDSPLRQADDAHLLQTDDLTVDEVVERIKTLARQSVTI